MEAVGGTVPFSDRDHEVLPVEGSVARTRPGFGGCPASLTNPRHYPVEAICQGCGEMVRSEHVHAGWKHTGRKPGEPR